MDTNTINKLEKGVKYFVNNNYIGDLIIIYSKRKWILRLNIGKIKKGNLLVYSDTFHIANDIYSEIIKYDLPLNEGINKSSNSNDYIL